jgi:hypothetical protein
VAPATDHRQVDAHRAAPLDRRQHIHVLVPGAFDELLVEHGLQVADLVAIDGGLLEGQRIGGLLHAPRQIIHHVTVAPAEEQAGQLHVGGVGLLVDQPDRARCSAGSGAAGRAASGC